MPIVFVIAHDWLLRVGVRAELRERGVEALGMESVRDIAGLLAAGGVPSAVVLEASQEAAANPAMQNLAQRVPTIVVASRTEPAVPQPAVAVLYRPVRVADVVARVLQILQGTAV